VGISAAKFWLAIWLSRGFLNKAARLMIKKNVIVASDLAEPGVPE